MQSDNGVVTVASNSAATPTGVNPAAAPPKAELLRQFAAGSNASDGGLVAQLTSNPFFTAVSLAPGHSILRTAII